jgi:hypothetical protein
MGIFCSGNEMKSGLKMGFGSRHQFNDDARRERDEQLPLCWLRAAWRRLHAWHKGFRGVFTERIIEARHRFDNWRSI